MNKIYLVLFLALFSNFTVGDYINESPRQIPVIDEVDVLVVGGSSYGVSAAASAAAYGAKVFLAAERPYLGADICRTRRLWIAENASTQLSKSVFQSSTTAVKSADFKYSASIEPDKNHPDTSVPSLLNDGSFGDPARDSVQYNQHVKIDIDLGSVQDVKRVCLFAYQRKDDFAIADFDLLSGIDGKGWENQATVKNTRYDQDIERVELCLEKNIRARYLSLRVHKGTGIKRILLGEILVETEQARQNSMIRPVKPLDIKYGLDKLLMSNGVTFLYGCYPTEVLKDSNGNVAGVVFANRAGRQAVITKKVVDASANAVVARLADARFEPFRAGSKRFERIVIGGDYINTVLEYEKKSTLVEEKYQAVRYAVDIDMESDTFAQYCKTEQIARDKSWSPGQVDASDKLIYSARKVKCKEAAGFDGLLAEGFDNLYVLGNAGNPAQPNGPISLFEYAEEFGEYLATAADKGSITADFKIVNGNKTDHGNNNIKGEVKEFLNGPRSFKQEYKTVFSDGLTLEVIAGYDVVVIGGGTSGAPAAIAASRQGAKTLVVEYLDGLGGIGTSGLIGRYCIGYRKGFTEEVDRGMAALGGYEYVVDNEGLGTPWDIELKKEWYRRELRKNDCDIWFGAIGCGAFVDEGAVKGVVVATPYGRVVVTADVVIDSTGNSDIAAAAGSDIIYTDADTVEVQGTGLPPRQLGARYTNTDYSFVDDGDMIDIWRMHVTAKKKFQGSYDIAQLIDTRERRRIKGRFVISPVDIYNGRTYPDTVALAYSNFDTHGYTTHPLFNLLTPKHSDFIYANVPYRCMLPEQLDGIIVTGLGISAHRDAVPVLRMQPDVQNHGYAAGTAAAIAAKERVYPANIEVAKVQKVMVDNGSIPANVLDAEDNYPPSDRQLEEALEEVADDYGEVAIFFPAPDRSIKLLKKAFADIVSDNERLVYAHILATLGDDTAADILIDKIASMDWDKGWNFTNYGQFGSTFSELDRYIISLGYAHVDRGVDVLAAKADKLDADSDFSHFCAIAKTAGLLKNERMAPVLYRLLKKDGMSGYALTDKGELDRYNSEFGKGKQIRNLNLREILLARSLYRCGDYNGLGRKILEDYRNDLRGHYARCANAILKE